MTSRKILAALVALAAAAALALGVAGTASPAAKRSHFIGTCAFTFGAPPLVITQCPDT